MLSPLVDLNARHNKRFDTLPTEARPGPRPTTAKGELARAGEDLLLAALPDKLILQAVDGWQSHPESTAKALGGAFLGLLAGGVADAVELGTGTIAGLVRLARFDLRSVGVKVDSETTVTRGLAETLGGHESSSSAMLSKHPDVQGNLHGRPVSLSFPDGGLPWRVQGKRMSVTVVVPGATDARIRRGRQDADLLKAGADPMFIKTSQFSPVSLFDPAGSDLVVKNGRATIDIVLPNKVDNMTTDEITKVLDQLSKTLDQLV